MLTSFNDNPRAKIFARLQVKRVACLSEIAFVMRWCGGVRRCACFAAKVYSLVSEVSEVRL